MKHTSLHMQQLNNKMLAFSALHKVAMPPTGWVKAIRLALGMSMQQLAKKLNITRQAVHDIEQREQDGSITIKRLREIGRVIDLKLVYGFVPSDGTLEMLVEKRATELARQIVLRTAHSMLIEDQGNSPERIEKAIKEQARIIIQEKPKLLWD